MKKVYNKETRNEEGVYYRKGDWGIEVADDFCKPNFTEEVPPQESLDDNCPCDWNEETEAWVLDTVEADDMEAKKYLKESDEALVRVIEDLINVLEEKSVIALEDLPIYAQDKLVTRIEMRKKLKK